MIAHANVIIAEYAKQGFDLTLRQLYYQFVSRDLIANRQSEYKRLGSVINDARLAGFIDWNAIVDRTRNLKALAHWDNEPSMVQACADQFRIDKWARQDYRLALFMQHHGHAPPEFKRLALNMDQVEEHNPPPNPAKITDSRAAAYIEEHGDESWELDALDPSTLSFLIAEAIDEVLDLEQWEEDEERETRGRDLLAYVAQVWPEIEKKFEEDGAT